MEKHHEIIFKILALNNNFYEIKIIIKLKRYLLYKKIAS